MAERGKGKYRWRRVLRERLPAWLGWVAPKGRSDCGRHALYVSESSPGGSAVVKHCYYCAYEETSTPGHSTKVTA